LQQVLFGYEWLQNQRHEMSPGVVRPSMVLSTTRSFENDSQDACSRSSSTRHEKKEYIDSNQSVGTFPSTVKLFVLFFF